MNGEIRQQLQRRMELKCLKKELEAQKEALEKELFPLYIAMHNEQVDVANLESKSLRNWFLDVIGKREGLLQKERMEAQRAKMNHDMVQQKLEYTAAQLESIRSELETLRTPVGGNWNPEDNVDLIVQELKLALDSGRAILKDNETVIKQIDYLIDLNRTGMSKSMMPGYLATQQKRINYLRSEVDRFAQGASNLPAAHPFLEPGKPLLPIDPHLMDEMVGGVGTDSVLRNVHNTLVAAKEEICGILHDLEIAIAQLE